MDHPQTFDGRLAELSPFEITAAEAPKTASWKSDAWPSTDEVPAAELYGCVDWYQYPEPGREESQKAS